MILAILFRLLLASSLSSPETQTVRPAEDTEAVLYNPDMGWVLYENYPLDARPNGSGTMNNLPHTTFEGCDDVAVMFAWSDVETEEGRYDWSRVDAAWDYWLRRGKRIHMRISTEPLFGWSHVQPQGGLGIPDWLLARIPEDQKQRRKDGPMFGWHVDARNPLYQKRLRHFLNETNAHFTGARAPVLVDLRGYGRWGEWHTGYSYPSLAERRAALQTVLEIWIAAFPERMLALSYSHDPDGPAALRAGPNNKLDPTYTQNHAEYLHYSAFDLALRWPNITLRRDGAGGAVTSNERKLNEHAYRELRRAPLMSEFVSSYAQVRAGGPAYLKWLVDDALSLHPNYISLLGYSGQSALDFMRERPDLFAHGLRSMGYRLVPLNVTLPKTLRAGETFAMNVEWINRARGRALRDYALRLRLADEQGRTLAQTTVGTLPTSRWLWNETHTINVNAAFPKIAGNGDKARLLLSLHDVATGRSIELPLSRRTRDEFAEIGHVGILR